MPFINLRDTPIRLPAGHLRIGRGKDVEIALPEILENPGDDGQFALLVVQADGSATLSKLSEAAPVFLNSVPAGAEPTPLLHGDRVEVDGVELRFADDRQIGATAEFPAFVQENVEPMAAPGMSNPVAAAAANRAPPGQNARVAAPVRNGRLISFVDGREYAVGEGGLSIGRDAGCDVVVPANAVSRRHGRIALEMRGYTLTDNSTNGLLVNGERIRSACLLKRGDIVRVGPEEFRFYEDQVEDDPTPSAPAPALIATPAQKAAPRSAAPPETPVLATFIVANQGADKGKAFDVRSLLTHIGRGAHNDITLDDDSVSDSHAKLQRRENRWILVDLESTNGTYVCGARLTGEAELRGEEDIRFGGAKLIFKRARSLRTPSAGTRVVAAFKRPPTPRHQQTIDPADGFGADERPGTPDESNRSLTILWLALLGVVALTASIIFRAIGTK
ncbi:MAG: FHA domain-containing protein [Gemmatimonadaceae bacterium]